jgi:hypothetical protein
LNDTDRLREPAWKFGDPLTHVGNCHRVNVSFPGGLDDKPDGRLVLRLMPDFGCVEGRGTMVGGPALPVCNRWSNGVRTRPMHVCMQGSLVMLMGSGTGGHDGTCVADADTGTVN